MWRVIIAPPQWAIDRGIAKPDETQSLLFEDKSSADEFAATGRVLVYKQVHAGNDTEMYAKRW